MQGAELAREDDDPPIGGSKNKIGIMRQDQGFEQVRL